MPSLPTNKILKISLIAGSALTTAACGNGKALRGYVFDTELANAIQPGVDNRASVETTLGTPTMMATFDEKTWYYVSTTVRVRPIFWPDATAHRVLVVSFNDSGVVSDVDNLGLEDMRDVENVSDKTATKGRKLNLFEQIFGSIGRFGGAAPAGAGNNQNRGPNG